MCKKIVFLFLFLFIISFLGCKAEDKKDNLNSNYLKDDLEWTNDEAIYVSIKKEFLSSVFEDIEEKFSDYKYEKVYVVNKYTYDNGDLYYRLLFVVKNDIDSFCDRLKKDERISSFNMCKDLAFESYDNRFMKYDKSIINVGESITISIKGDCNIYYQPFYFDLLCVKPINYNFRNEYNISDYPEIDDISFIDSTLHWLIIGFSNSNYYKIVKTIDLLARNTSNECVDFLEMRVIQPIWEIDNEELASFVINNDNSITLKAIKPGNVKVSYDGIECSISIITE